MKKNNSLQQTPEYWTTQIQLSLLSLIQDYLKENHMTRSGLAAKMGVTKGYVTQVMNGDYDHRISKMVELAMAIGYVPQVSFVPAVDAFAPVNTFKTDTLVVGGFNKETSHFDFDEKTPSYGMSSKGVSLFQEQKVG